MPQSTTDVLSAELDFVTDGLEGETNGEKLQSWLREFAHESIAGELINECGPGGGWPVIRLTGPKVFMEAALLIYHGGDRESAQWSLYGE